MDIATRLKKVRNALGYSQAKLGDVLGVSRDVVSNLENNRLKQPEQKEPLYRLLCQKLNVNERWLRTGEGEMFQQPDVFDLGELCRQRGASELEKQLLLAYFDLPADIRKELAEHFKKALVGQPEEDVPDSPKEFEKPRGLAVARGGQRVEFNPVDNLDDLLPPDDPIDI